MSCVRPARPWPTALALLSLLPASAGAAPLIKPGNLPPPTTPQQKSLLVQMQDAFTNIAQTVSPTVVNIKAERMPTPDPTQPEEVPPSSGIPQGPGRGQRRGSPFSGPGRMPVPRPSQATGSGVIVRSDGYVLTNDHVVDGAVDGLVTVTLSDGREFRGRVYQDYRSDLAVVKIDPGPTPLPVAAFADSDDVRPGQWAIAVGSPFDLQNTVTVGIISAVGRHQLIPGETPGAGRYYPELIQTDAAINPGNSGGPLFNIEGQVVGINVAIESPVEGSAGIGFAIPSRAAEQIMTALIQSGKVTRGYLGLAPDDLTPALAAQYGQREGAFVRDVSLDSPAGKAGLQAADIVTQFDGHPIKDEVSLRTAISSTPPGKAVTITYVRDGRPHVATATIGTAPAPPGDTTPAPSLLAVPAKPALGVRVRELTAHDRVTLGLPPDTTGVFILGVSPAGPAQRGGLDQGMVIQKIGQRAVNTPAEFQQAIAGLTAGSSVTVVALSRDPGQDQTHQTAYTVHL